MEPEDFLPADRSAERVRELNILAVDLYRAVAGASEQRADGSEEGVRAPRLTIEAPPESITNMPEGFVLVEKKKQ